MASESHILLSHEMNDLCQNRDYFLVGGDPIGEYFVKLSINHSFGMKKVPSKICCSQEGISVVVLL